MQVTSLILKKMQQSLQKILHAVVSSVPKKRRFVLRGFPDYEDNLLAIHEELIKIGVKKIVWVVDNIKVDPPIDLGESTIMVKRGSLRDLYYSCTSKYLFITHGHFLEAAPRGQILINLWHGIPFKQVGVKQGMNKRDDTYLTCTSEFTRKIFHESFGVSEDKIHVTGQPRTDRMMSVNKREVLSKLLGTGNHPEFLFVWLPTYRKTNYMNGKLDGRNIGNIFNCTDFSASLFNAMLRKNNAYCIVKPHPMAATHEHTGESNILFIDEKWLANRRTSLYQLIGVADCLISDISSVIADFMLLDRPIVLLFEDIDEYEKNRGFSFNPITHYLPADVAKSFDMFVVEIEKALRRQDVYKERRKTIMSLFFDHSDEYSAKRVLNIAFAEDEHRRKKI